MHCRGGEQTDLALSDQRAIERYVRTKRKPSRGFLPPPSLRSVSARDRFPLMRSMHLGRAGRSVCSLEQAVQIADCPYGDLTSCFLHATVEDRE